MPGGGSSTREPKTQQAARIHKASQSHPTRTPLATPCAQAPVAAAAGLDGSVRLFNFPSVVEVAPCRHAAPLWRCCWLPVRCHDLA